MFCKFFIVIVALFLSDLPVRGADIQWINLENDLGDGIIFEGTIVEGDLQKLIRIVDMSHWKKTLIIMFHSSGGDVFEAVKIGRYIRHKKFITAVNDDNICYSACFFSFIGGKTRIIDPMGEIGVHQFYGAQGDSDSIQSRTQHLTSELMDYTEAMGVSIETIKIAARTLPQDMYIFNKSELKRFHLIGDGDHQNTDRTKAKPPMSAPKSAERVFWQQDGWKVKMDEDKNFCSMYKHSSMNGMLWFHSAKDLKFMNMSYVHKPENLTKLVKGNKKTLEITLTFDNKEENILSAVYDKGDRISSFDMPLQKKNISNLWNHDMVYLSIGSKFMDMINLTGSAKAFQTLNKCYDALP